MDFDNNREDLEELKQEMAILREDLTRQLDTKDREILTASERLRTVEVKNQHARMALHQDLQFQKDQFVAQALAQEELLKSRTQSDIAQRELEVRRLTVNEKKAIVRAQELEADRRELKTQVERLTSQLAQNQDSHRMELQTKDTETKKAQELLAAKPRIEVVDLARSEAHINQAEMIALTSTLISKNSKVRLEDLKLVLNAFGLNISDWNDRPIEEKTVMDAAHKFYDHPLKSSSVFDVMILSTVKTVGSTKQELRNVIRIAYALVGPCTVTEAYLPFAFKYLIDTVLASDPAASCAQSCIAVCAITDLLSMKRPNETLATSTLKLLLPKRNGCYMLRACILRLAAYLSSSYSKLATLISKDDRAAATHISRLRDFGSLPEILHSLKTLESPAGVFMVNVSTNGKNGTWLYRERASRSMSAISAGFEIRFDVITEEEIKMREPDYKYSFFGRDFNLSDQGVIVYLGSNVVEVRKMNTELWRYISAVDEDKIDTAEGQGIPGPKKMLKAGKQHVETKRKFEDAA